MLHKASRSSVMLRCFRETEAWWVEKRGMLTVKLAGRWARLSPQSNLHYYYTLPTCAGMIGCPAKTTPASLDLRGFRAKSMPSVNSVYAHSPTFGRMRGTQCRRADTTYPSTSSRCQSNIPEKASRFEMKPSNLQMRPFFLPRLDGSSCICALLWPLGTSVQRTHHGCTNPT